MEWRLGLKRQWRECGAPPQRPRHITLIALGYRRETKKVLAGFIVEREFASDVGSTNADH
jgi:hypothetical protein